MTSVTPATPLMSSSALVPRVKATSSSRVVLISSILLAVTYLLVSKATRRGEGRHCAALGGGAQPRTWRALQCLVVRHACRRHTLEVTTHHSTPPPPPPLHPQVAICAALLIWQLAARQSERHVVAWGVAGIFVLIAVPLSLRDVHLHLAHWVAPSMQRHYVRIMLIVGRQAAHVAMSSPRVTGKRHLATTTQPGQECSVSWITRSQESQ